MPVATLHHLGRVSCVVVVVVMRFVGKGGGLIWRLLGMACSELGVSREC